LCQVDERKRKVFFIREGVTRSSKKKNGGRKEIDIKRGGQIPGRSLWSKGGTSQLLLISTNLTESRYPPRKKKLVTNNQKDARKKKTLRSSLTRSR